MIGLAVVLALTLSCIDLGACQNETSWHPNYHVAPEQGWMNDPNGLAYYDGHYHVFWQYHPNDSSPGLIYWGHARSTDMLRWEYLPIALAPSRPEDIDGIFSGSAVIKNDNLTVIYTGVSENSTLQRQMLAATSDGITFDKYGVIIDNEDNRTDFRDPKAWWQNDSWFVVIGSKTPEGRGEVLLYKSSDLFNWTFEQSLAAADEKLGYMWECPDFFTLGDKQILLINPQGVEQDGFDYQNLYQTGYFVGSWTPGVNYKIEKGFREIDHGHDFYASQTFLAPDGRRILIAWLGMWESEFPERLYGWAGMLTLPRELTLSRSGDLEIRPIREIRNIRQERAVSTDMLLHAKNQTSLLLDESSFGTEALIYFDLVLTTCETFGIELREDNSSAPFEGVRIYADRSQDRLFLERYYPRFNIESSNRSVAIDLTQPELSLNIFIDSSSVEVFVNDGQAVLSSRIYPTNGQRALFVFGTKGTLRISRFTIWDI